jgi:predicted Zn finger-like uncharacterized protein
MKFVCDRCQTKYSIADERVRGKVLKVKCKSCANVITVREARRPSAAGLSPIAAAPVGRARSGPAAALSVPAEAPEIDSERTQLAMSPFGADPFPEPFPDLLTPAAPPAPVRRPTGSLAAVEPEDQTQWYMALDGNRTGPFTKATLVDKLMPLAKGADVHIWNEKLDGWKPPTAVADIAAEIVRRRAPAPPPPPLPGVRRPTPPPMPPMGGLGAASSAPHVPSARKPTGPHAPPSPVAHGPGTTGSKLPPPGGIHPALAARGAEHGAADAASLLETPGPMPHAHPKTNGANGHAPPAPVNSDVMQMLNLPGGTQTAPGAPPRLMSVTSTVGWTASVDAAKGRSKSTLLILALLGVIGLIVVVAVISLKKPPRPAAVAVKPPAVETTPPAAEKTPEPPPPPPVAPEPPPEPVQRGKGKRAKPSRTLAGKQTAGSTGTATTAVTPPPPPPPGGDAARFRDNHNMNITGGGGTRLPPPDQSAITKVISNNRAGIKVCYQRALTRDNSLTHGKLSVKLSIGISGRVKHMALEGPTQFRLLLEPCIKEVVQRWVFPQASEEYGTEFPLVFQGNE